MNGHSMSMKESDGPCLYMEVIWLKAKNHNEIRFRTHEQHLVIFSVTFSGKNAIVAFNFGGIYGPNSDNRNRTSETAL